MRALENAPNCKPSEKQNNMTGKYSDALAQRQLSIINNSHQNWQTAASSVRTHFVVSK
jgi:hypothetical protein